MTEDEMGIIQKKRVSTVDRETLGAAKYVNVHFITKDEKTGHITEINLLLGRGDEEYIRRIIQTVNEYLDDPTVEPMFEVE